MLLKENNMDIEETTSIRANGTKRNNGIFATIVQSDFYTGKAVSIYSKNNKLLCTLR